MCGNIIYFRSFRSNSSRALPDPCTHLPGLFFFALYFELLLDADGKTGPIDIGHWGPTV